MCSAAVSSRGAVGWRVAGAETDACDDSEKALRSRPPHRLLARHAHTSTHRHTPTVSSPHPHPPLWCPAQVCPRPRARGPPLACCWRCVRPVTARQAGLSRERCEDGWGLRGARGCGGGGGATHRPALPALRLVPRPVDAHSAAGSVLRSASGGAAGR